MKHPTLRLPFVAAAFLCITPLSVIATDQNRIDTLTVVVTPDEQTSHPIAFTETKADDQPAANEQSLQDYLDPVPGLFTQNQDNTAQGLRPSIRGFGSRAAFGVRGIRVLIDGVPLTLPDGQTDLDALDLGLLESAQVIRGPSATLFGNAAGGAILLRNRPIPATPQARFDVHAGSFGSQRFRLEGSRLFGNSAVRGAYTQADVDGPRDHAHTDTRLLNAHLLQTLGNGQLRAGLSVLDITSEDPGGLTANEVDQDRRQARARNLQFNAGETIEQQRVSLGWQGQWAGWDVRSTGYAGQRDFANRLPFTGGGQVQFDRNFGGIGTTFAKPADWVGFKHQLSAGLDAQLQEDDRERFDNNNGSRGARTLAQDESADSIGLFARDSIALTDHWSTSLGLRYDRLNLEVDDRFLSDGDDSGDRDIDNVSADISLSRHFANHMIYGRLATSFETPTFTELANPNGGGFNPDLESTDALNKEIGIKGQWAALNYTVAIYQIDVDDELSPFQLVSQPGRTFFRNAGETRRQGIELTTDYRIDAHWSVNASASLADNEFENGNLKGNKLPGLPDKTLWLAANHRQGAWHSAVIAQYVGELYADDANTEKVSGYSLLHLQTAFRFSENWEVEAAIDNLLDKEYNDNIRINAFGGRYFEPAGGRTYRMALSWRFI